MLGRRECLAAVVAALMAGTAVVVLAGLDHGDVVEVRVAGSVPAGPELAAVQDLAGPGQLSVSSTTTAPAATADSGRVVWAEKGDVWLYEAKSGKRRALTTDGDTQQDSEPRFRDSTHVTYLSSEKESGPDPRLVEVNLRTGHTRVLTRVPGHRTVYGWSPDGTMLAYYGAASDEEATELHITGNGPLRSRRFAPILGRGGFINYDERRVEWSPDGRHLLVQDTALDTSQDDTLSILNADGTNAIAPRLGTWARWSADGRTIYCLCATGVARNDWLWQAIDLASGASTPLLISAGARPSLSPDGRMLAFDDGEDTPSVHVLDLRTLAGRPRLLARAALAPVWLGPSRLAVTNTRPCRGTEDDCLAGGHGSMFEPAGTASAVDLTTGRRSPLPPMATDGADTDASAR